MQKIKKITLNNFKFFHGKESIELDRKNLLLYGENGAGKSSIYWALYTFLQSVFKTDNKDIQKYFDPSKPESLVNRFANGNPESEITIYFEDGEGTVTEKCISLDKINTKTGRLVKDANQSSDLINYKLLSRLYDFRNSEEIDLFHFFEREVMMFIQFRIEFTKHDDSAGNKNASDWWKYLKAELEPYPGIYAEPYRKFQTAVSQFNSEFEFYLNKITEQANKYLQNNFKQKIKIRFEYQQCQYNPRNKHNGGRDRRTIPPKIMLKIEFLHEKLNGGLIDLNRPHTFLNEAKLTTIALAIRLAIIDEKLVSDAPKILVLDDLLISLDMSNRDCVLDIILKEYKHFQLLIFTHDRAFFNLIRKRLDAETSNGDWIFKEMFYDVDETTGIPKPFIPDLKDYLHLAKKYLKEFDYPACANYLRKECERLLTKQILPENLTLKVTDDKGSVTAQLDDLIANFKKYYEGVNGDFTKFNKLKEYKDLLLNPLSHDNIESPIYRLELESVLAVLIEMQKLKPFLLVPVDGKSPDTIKLYETDSISDNWVYTVKFLENFRAIKDIDGKYLFNNPDAEFIDRKNLTKDLEPETLNVKTKLNNGYSNIRHALGIKDTQPPKDLKQIIEYEGRKLHEIFN